MSTPCSCGAHPIAHSGGGVLSGLMLRRWFPVLDQLRGYDGRTAMRDAQAGVVVSALLVPAGIGYAVASGLPPITGLYATIVPLVVYGLLGPSRILIYGPDSSLTPLIAGLV